MEPIEGALFDCFFMRESFLARISNKGFLSAQNFAGKKNKKLENLPAQLMLIISRQKKTSLH
jgi:hypothetical protein